MEEVQIVGTSLAVSDGLAKEGRDTKEGRWGAQGRRGLWNQQSPFCMCWGQKNPSLLTFSWVIPESSVWSQDFTLPASFSISSSGSEGSTCWLLPAVSLSFQEELRLSGSKTERGPHACHLHFPQRSMLLATSLLWPPLPALAGI